MDTVHLRKYDAIKAIYRFGGMESVTERMGHKLNRVDGIPTEFNQQQTDLVIGTMLGDASIPARKRSGQNNYYSFEQTEMFDLFTEDVKCGNFTQSQLASKYDVNQRTIRRWIWRMKHV